MNDPKRRWVACFSQTGSEVYEVSRKLNRIPDLILYNTNFGKLKPMIPAIVDDPSYTVIITEPKPGPNVYRQYLQPGDFVTLNGWLRIIPPEICNEYEIYNGHPGLITVYPELKGKDPQKKAYELGLETSGCVIHRVTPVVDDGEIVKSREVKIANLELNDIIKKLHSTSIELWVEFLKEKLK